MLLGTFFHTYFEYLVNIDWFGLEKDEDLAITALDMRLNVIAMPILIWIIEIYDFTQLGAEYHSMALNNDQDIHDSDFLIDFGNITRKVPHI